MRRTVLRTTVLVLAGLTASGCMTTPVARYVYQDGQFGVIGIPQNSSFGRENYVMQAHELMSRHFPDGYEVVRAEEVVEGERFLDAGKRTELATEPSVSALDQMIKLGRLSSTQSFEQKDKLPILESRILYKRRTAAEPPGVNGFAAVASARPEFYLDPNEMTRCKSREVIAAAKKEGLVSARGDTAVLKSAHEPSDKSAHEPSDKK